jgi:hypothetical protein
MSLEYYTAQFENDSSGIAKKNAYTQQMAAQGWRIASEVIEQGHIKGGEACCGAVICLPMAFLAGRTPSIVTVTFVRGEQAIGRFCPACGTPVPGEAAFCGRCGKPVPALADPGGSPTVSKTIQAATAPPPSPAQGQEDSFVGGIALAVGAVLLFLFLAAERC